MKVQDPQAVAAVQRSEPAAPARPVEENRDAEPVKRSADTASLVAAARSAAAAARLEHLEAVAAAVKQGTYRPNPQAIAQQILDDAALDAKLQAVLQG